MKPAPQIDAANATDDFRTMYQNRTGLFEGARAEGRYKVRALEPRNVSMHGTLRAEIDAFVKAGDVIRAAMATKALERLQEVAWEDEFDNLVLTLGKNNLLDNGLAGSAYTAAFYVGLVDGATAPTFAATDSVASHAGWTENTGYTTPANRGTAAWSAAASGAKALSAAISFSGWAAAGTVAGALLATVATKGATTGVIYSAGAFTGGNAAVSSTTTLQVSYSTSL
jgi:hypothetical protein